MSSVRNSKRFKALAAALREQAGRHGVTLVAGEADDILAERLSAVATQLGITERTALDRYVTEEFVARLADTIGAQVATYRDAVQDTEPVSITLTDVGRIVAALGMVVKLAVAHAEHTRADAAGITHDGADAMVGVGAAIVRAAGSSHVDIGGQTLVWIRGVLVRAIGLLREGRWQCPCRSPHPSGADCELRARLISDLNLVGGWLVDEGEASAEHR
jgi:hypothetical protein